MNERDLYRAGIIKEVLNSLANITIKNVGIYGEIKGLYLSLKERKQKRTDEIKKLEVLKHIKNTNE